jgi:probable phosphoglycerate mutase
LDNHKSPYALVLLIRHATNDWVSSKTLAGWTPGVHLNDEGRRQAETLAERLNSLPIAAIYSSPLERAVETAEPLAKAKGLPVQVRDGLGETRLGEWTGQTLEELAKTDLWKIVQHYPSGVTFPGGETIRDMQARMVAELETVRALHPGCIVAVVSHADPIKSVIAHYAGMHLDLFQRLSVSPASVTAIALGPMGPRLMSLNDTGNLDYLAKSVRAGAQPAEGESTGQAAGDGDQKEQSDD